MASVNPLLPFKPAVSSLYSCCFTCTSDLTIHSPSQLILYHRSVVTYSIILWNCCVFLQWNWNSFVLVVVSSLLARTGSSAPVFWSTSQIIMASTLAPVTAESRPMFSIERILGLELERPGNCLKLHRPWAGEAQKIWI